MRGAQQLNFIELQGRKIPPYLITQNHNAPIKSLSNGGTLKSVLQTGKDVVFDNAPVALENSSILLVAYNLVLLTWFRLFSGVPSVNNPVAPARLAQKS